jgi:hypothetical protein
MWIKRQRLMLVEMLRISGVGRLVRVVSSMFLLNSVLFLMLGFRFSFPLLPLRWIWSSNFPWRQCWRTAFRPTSFYRSNTPYTKRSYFVVSGISTCVFLFLCVCREILCKISITETVVILCRLNPSFCNSVASNKGDSRCVLVHSNLLHSSLSM